MSDLVFAEKDAAVVLVEALAIYKANTVSAANPDGITLAPADPRRLHLQALLLPLTQQRQKIDYAAKQNLLRYVDKNMPIESAVFIQALAELWGEAPLPGKPSTCTLRFTFAVAGPQVVAAGKRATNGTNNWAVIETTTSPSALFVDALAECTVVGEGTNDVAPGQIDTLVDTIPGCSGVVNLTETINGRSIETTEAFRERLRSVPESRSTCGPRMSYEAAALDTDASVAAVVVLSARDGDDMASDPLPGPGDVWVFITEGTRDAEGVLIDTIPTPSGGLLTAVETALSEETVRPLTDHVVAKAPVFNDFDLNVTYFVAKSRKDSVPAIQLAAEAAFEAFVLWQQYPGRDKNPSELTTRLVNAGAKRVEIVSPAFNFEALKSDECCRIGYRSIVYGGVEND